jgi:hypothetical protein
MTYFKSTKHNFLKKSLVVCLGWYAGRTEELGEPISFV